MAGRGAASPRIFEWGGGSNRRQGGQPTPKYPKNRKKTPDFGHFILKSGGSTHPVFKSAVVRTPPTPPSATPLVAGLGTPTFFRHIKLMSFFRVVKIIVWSQNNSLELDRIRARIL